MGRERLFYYVSCISMVSNKPEKAAQLASPDCLQTVHVISVCNKWLICSLKVYWLRHLSWFLRYHYCVPVSLQAVNKDTDCHSV